MSFCMKPNARGGIRFVSRNNNVASMEAKLDFSTLEESYPSFRSDELYFIRMASPYIEGIFWGFFRTHNKKRATRLYDIARQELEQSAKSKAKGSPDTKKHLREAIIPD